MISKLLNRLDLIAVTTGAAILCTVYTRCFSSQQAEACSELLCWLLMPTLFGVFRGKSQRESRKVLPGTHGTTRQPLSSTSIWIAAGSIGILCFYRVESKAIVLLPALVPTLLFAQSRLRPEFLHSITNASDSSFWSPLVSTTWGTILVSSCCVFALAPWDIWSVGLSSIAVASLLVAYVALTPRAAMHRTTSVTTFDAQDLVMALSPRVSIVLVAGLGLHTLLFGFPGGSFTATASLGVVKALSWSFTIRACQYTGSWCIAAAIEIFSVMSTLDPLTASSDLHAWSRVVSSSLALGQVIQMLPKRSPGRSVLWALLLIALLPFVYSIYATRAAQSSSPRSFGFSQRHPVDALAREARADFENLLQRQSQNYTAARQEYQRRYGLEPPPGFEAWYEFATLHQSPVIDDFDMIYEAISPFWRLSGKEVLQAMQDAQRTGASELWYCRLSSGQAKTGCTHRHREFDRGIALLFDSLLGEELDGILDNVAFLVNHLDEPRVLLPPSAGDGDHRGFNLTFMSEQPTWNAVSRSCAARTNARGDQSTPRVEAFGIPFVANRAAMMDLCQHPEYKSTHGLFMSPTSFPLIEGLLPVLSTGSLSTMGDILFPSPAYLDPEFVYDGDRDVDWERKRNNLYWAGSTTGGFASTDEWPQFHRQRFVRLAQNLERRAHFYLRDREGLGARVASFFLNTRLYDVAFTRILQCARPHCRSQKAYFNMRRWADRDEALRSRLVFDLDGNGISGRYYRLLASKSTPLKQTLFREWHDERLVPWVHYIPVSQGMEELPELVFYLTSTESGQRIARDVAEQGREWFARSLRPVDMSIYVYRLLLELARLQDPERQAA